MFLNKFKKWMTIAIFIAVLFQNIFFPSWANFFGTLIVLVSWRLTYWLVLQPYNLKKYTFSTFILLGFSLTNFCLPVILILTEWKPLIFNLKYPIAVIIHLFLSFFVLIVSFLIYKNDFNFIREFLQKLLKRTPIFIPPSKQQLWIMGFIGLMAILVKKVFFKLNDEDNSSSEIVNLIAGFAPFAFLPFLIPFKKVFSFKYESYSKLILILYFILLILIGVLVNSRGLFMQGLLIVGLVYFLGLLTKKFDYRIFKIKTILTISIVGLIVTGPISDLGTSMVVVRSMRSDISATQLMNETINVYQNKEELLKYKKLSKVIVTDWDETYFDNIFIARFSNLKFADASLEQAFKLKNLPNESIQNTVVDKIWAILPQPILNFLDIQIDKTKINEGSLGDYLYSKNSDSGMGGFRTGNFVGLGLASFGWWYLMVLFIGSFLLYNFVDAFVVYRNKLGMYMPSVLGLMSLDFFFTFFGISSASESVTTIFHYIIRGWIQLVILYIIVYYISKKISQIL